MRTLNYVFKNPAINLFLIILFFSGSFYTVNAQNMSEPGSPGDPSKPDVQIKVNKELDKDGNVIRYDSSYTWSWSSDGSRPFPSDFFTDSNKTDFFKPFENNFFFGNDLKENYFDPFGFSNDSVFNDYFSNPDINKLHKEIQDMLKQQQKMMEEFFGQPHALPTPGENKNNEQKKAPPKKTSEGIDI